MKKNTAPTKPDRSAMASTRADLRELKGNSSATVKELQAFLRELKGKSPQEMLGVVAASSLMRSLTLSTAIIVGAILLFTIIPFLTQGTPKTSAKETVTTPAATPRAPEETAPPVNVAPKADLAPLGVGAELPAPPNQNPLENKGDDFLKDLE